MPKTINGRKDLLFFLSSEMKITNLSMTGVKLRLWCLRVSHCPEYILMKRIFDIHTKGKPRKHFELYFTISSIF